MKNILGRVTFALGWRCQIGDGIRTCPVKTPSIKSPLNNRKSNGTDLQGPLNRFREKNIEIHAATLEDLREKVVCKEPGNLGQFLEAWYHFMPALL